MEVAFEDDLAVPAHQQTVQSRQAFTSLDRGHEIGLPECQRLDKPRNHSDSYRHPHRGYCLTVHQSTNLGYVAHHAPHGERGRSE